MCYMTTCPTKTSFNKSGLLFCRATAYLCYFNSQLTELKVPTWINMQTCLWCFSFWFIRGKQTPSAKETVWDFQSLVSNILRIQRGSEKPNLSSDAYRAKWGLNGQIITLARKMSCWLRRKNYHILQSIKTNFKNIHSITRSYCTLTLIIQGTTLNPCCILPPHTWKKKIRKQLPVTSTALQPFLVR